MIRLADYVMQRIEEEGVKHVFYVPGGQCVYLTDALRRNENISGVSMHHEQSASMAALSYSIYNENLGACLVTTGCAGTNTMTGVLHAWQDSVPCIFISGQQNYHQTIVASGLPLRQVGVQEADIAKIMKPITKYAVTISNASEIAWHLDKAIYLAKTGRKGPVWIDIPLNVQNAMIDEKKLERFVGEEEMLQPNMQDIQYVLDELKKAKRPVILAGNGIRLAHAVQELSDFVEQFAIPTVFTRLSYDLLPYNNKYNFGVVSGLAGASRYANFIIQNSDLVISIGSRLSLDTTGSETQQFAREAKIIVVDIDEVEHQKDGVKIDRFIHADAKIFFDMISEFATTHASSEWLEKCNHWKEVFPLFNSSATGSGKIDSKYCMYVISENMPEKAVIISDAGFTGASAPAASAIKEGQRILHSFAQGEMGYSLPAACGVAELTNAPVVAYTGDGSFMMNLQELQTVKRNQYNIKVVIMNNNGYSGVRHGQKAHFRGKTIGTDSSCGIDFPDYRKIADAFGISYVRIEQISELQNGIIKMFEKDTPFILEIMTDPEQYDLHNALVTYGKRKFGFRPIEDQSPFIEREIFFNEMIVEPLETSYGKPV